jgi:hypothetical protein
VIEGWNTPCECRANEVWNNQSADRKVMGNLLVIPALRATAKQSTDEPIATGRIDRNSIIVLIK